jgi:hypothetical protein
MLSLVFPWVGIAGPVAFQSDYGERYNLTTNAGNTGLGIGIILEFSYTAECNCILLKHTLMTTLNYEVNYHIQNRVKTIW